MKTTLVSSRLHRVCHKDTGQGLVCPSLLVDLKKSFANLHDKFQYLTLWHIHICNPWTIGRGGGACWVTGLFDHVIEPASLPPFHIISIYSRHKLGALTSAPCFSQFYLGPLGGGRAGTCYLACGCLIGSPVPPAPPAVTQTGINCRSWESNN